MAKVHHNYGTGEDWEAPVCPACKVLLDTRGPADILLDAYEENRLKFWLQ
jgi:hypothetical protein